MTYHNTECWCRECDAHRLETESLELTDSDWFADPHRPVQGNLLTRVQVSTQPKEFKMAS